MRSQRAARWQEFAWFDEPAADAATVGPGRIGTEEADEDGDDVSRI
jgi:hypothetical protein